MALEVSQMALGVAEINHHVTDLVATLVQKNKKNNLLRFL